MNSVLSKYVGAAEIARRIGVHRSTIYRYDERKPTGWPPSHNIMGQVKWLREDVDAFIEKLENGGL